MTKYRRGYVGIVHRLATAAKQCRGDDLPLGKGNRCQRKPVDGVSHGINAGLRRLKLLIDDNCAIV